MTGPSIHDYEVCLRVMKYLREKRGEISNKVIMDEMRKLAEIEIANLEHKIDRLKTYV